tara:strand:+ start:757 stop:915 length:159 start_codon:yes stop_codon:yes gene_type:complete
MDKKDLGYLTIIVLMLIGFNISIANAQDKIYKKCYSLMESASVLEEHYNKGD